MSFLIKKESLLKNLSIAYIVVFTTVLYAFVVNGAMNALMLGMMFLSPIILLVYFPRLKKNEVPIYLLMGSIIITSLMHMSNFRLSTVVYSLLFIITFLTYKRIISSHFLSSDSFLHVVEKIVVAFAVVLLLQQLLTLFNLPVFNKCWNFSNRFKLNSLALEPSYIGGTLFVLMYAFVNVYEHITGRMYSMKLDLKHHKYIWLSYCYVSLTSGSSWTLFAFCIMGLYVFRRKKISFFFALILLILLVAMNYEMLLQVESFKRLYRFIPAIFSGNTDVIHQVDLSAAARINPVFFYFESIDLSSLNFWFGHGNDYAKSTLIVKLLGHSNAMEQGNATGGLFPAFFMDYGFISGGVFLWCLKKYAVQKFLSVEMLAWMFLFMPVMFNTYMQWQFFLIMYSQMYFTKRN